MYSNPMSSNQHLWFAAGSLVLLTVVSSAAYINEKRDSFDTVGVVFEGQLPPVQQSATLLKVGRLAGDGTPRLGLILEYAPSSAFCSGNPEPASLVLQARLDNREPVSTACLAGSLNSNKFRISIDGTTISIQVGEKLSISALKSQNLSWLAQQRVVGPVRAKTESAVTRQVVTQFHSTGR